MNPTPEERARCVNLQNIPKAREQITFEIRQAEAGAIKRTEENCQEWAKTALAAARAEEREACAVVSEDDGTPAGKHIAMMIRARND